MMHRAASLDDLVDDILIEIIQTLCVRDILALRQASKRYQQITCLRCIWYAKFCEEVLASNLPIPGLRVPLSRISSYDLEWRTLHALRLSHRWPRLEGSSVLVENTEPEAVDQVMLIPGGTQLLTVHGNRVVYWLIGQSEMADGVRKVAEWVFPYKGSCKIVRDSANLTGDVIAIGSAHEPDSSATVMSIGIKPTFTKLCDYARVPGTIAGIRDRFVIMDTTQEPGGGGLEMLDWQAKTAGTALLPRFAELFGNFVDFVFFSNRILVAWETCISVFGIPVIPDESQIVVEHIQAFRLYEPISRPIAFTTCHAPSFLGDETQNHKRPASGRPSLTIVARPKGRTTELVQSMLIPLPQAPDADNDDSTFPFRLIRSSPLASAYPFRAPRSHFSSCELRVGPAGRGLWVNDGDVRFCSPSLVLLPPFEMQLAPAFEERKPSCRFGNLDVKDCDHIDFDEGMGRLVIARESGGFEIVQLF